MWNPAEKHQAPCLHEVGLPALINCGGGAASDKLPHALPDFGGGGEELTPPCIVASYVVS